MSYNYSQRIINIQNTLSNALTYLGYQHCIPLNTKTSDPQTNLQETIYNLLDILPTFNVLQECTFINVPKKEIITSDHQNALFNVFKIFDQAMKNMAQMASLFYQEKYSKEIHVSFMKINELMKNVIDQLYRTQFYQSGKQAFKQKIYKQMSQNFQIIVKSQAQKCFFSNIHQQSCSLRASTFEKNINNCLKDDFDSDIKNPQIEKNHNEKNIISQLKQKVSQLEEQLQNLKLKYTKNIQKYKQTFIDMQQQTHKYKLQIQSLQDDLSRAQEQKYQDQCFINTLKDKIKSFQIDQKRRCSWMASPKCLKGLELSSQEDFDQCKKSQNKTLDNSAKYKYKNKEEKSKNEKPISSRIFVQVKKERK